MNSGGVKPSSDADPSALNAPTTPFPLSRSEISRSESETEGAVMGLDPNEMVKVINRLKRAQGQLAGVLRMLEEGRDCEDIVTQLSAVTTALNRAGFAIIATGMRQCLIEADGVETLPVQKLEKLFLSLA
jgi:DNA-binding FrmR family transcriptional regulator